MEWSEFGVREAVSGPRYRGVAMTGLGARKGETSQGFWWVLGMVPFLA